MQKEIAIKKTDYNKDFEKEVQDLFLANFYRDHGYKIVERAPQDKLCDYDVIPISGIPKEVIKLLWSKKD